MTEQDVRAIEQDIRAIAIQEIYRLVAPDANLELRGAAAESAVRDLLCRHERDEKWRREMARSLRHFAESLEIKRPPNE